ncbi:MAG TPA: hypothetical protein VE959_33540 [Bryobacteraceae bacterium]|nr:hypothetical protein [Bryobacteraceae bacterium]
MADFLTRVAQRALGVAPVVQPLIAPQFAPVSRSAAAPESAPSASWGEVVENVAEHESPAPRPAARATPVEAKDRERPRTELPADRVATVFKPAMRDAAPRDTAPERAATDETGPEPGTRKSIEQPAVPRVELPAARRAAEVRAEDPSAPRAAIAAETRLVKEPAAAPERQWREPALPGERRDRQELSGAAAPPPIRITIGRIDVRAILPPAEAAPRKGGANGRPALTLEKYTRQRNRRER